MLFKVLLPISIFLGFPSVQAAKALQPCKMVVQKTLNAGDPELKMEHMTMLDKGRKLHLFFGTHNDPSKTPIADVYSKMGEPKEALKYVKEFLKEKDNKKSIAAFKKDKAYYEKVLKKNKSQLKWMGFEGANTEKKDSFDATQAHKERKALITKTSAILNAFGQVHKKQALSKQQIKDFLLFSFGPTVIAPINMNKDLKKVDMKYTEETVAYNKALSIHKAQESLRKKLKASDDRYNRLHEEAQVACKNFLEKKTKKPSKKCSESFARFQKDEKESLKPHRDMEKKRVGLLKAFDKAQDGRDHSLAKVVQRFKGNGVVFRGGDHKDLVKKLLEKQCQDRLSNQKSQGQGISQ